MISEEMRETRGRMRRKERENREGRGGDTFLNALNVFGLLCVERSALQQQRRTLDDVCRCPQLMTFNNKNTNIIK